MDQLLCYGALVQADAMLFYERGVWFEQMGDNQQALAVFSEGIRLKPSLELFIARGRLLCDRLGDPDSGLNDFLSAQNLSPQNAVVHMHLCVCYRQLGRIDDASRHAHVLIGLAPSDALSHICLGQCLLAENRFHGAAKELRLAASLDPSSAIAWTGLSRALRKLGRMAEAKECIQKSIEIEGPAGSLIALATLLIELKEFHEAMETLQSAKKMELTEADTLLVDGYLELARNMK